MIEPSMYMEWIGRKDGVKDSLEATATVTPENADDCYFDEDTSIDEGMVRDMSP